MDHAGFDEETAVGTAVDGGEADGSIGGHDQRTAGGGEVVHLQGAIFIWAPILVSQPVG